MGINLHPQSSLAGTTKHYPIIAPSIPKQSIKLPISSSSSSSSSSSCSSSLPPPPPANPPPPPYLLLPLFLLPRLPVSPLSSYNHCLEILHLQASPHDECDCKMDSLFNSTQLGVSWGYSLVYHGDTARCIMWTQLSVSCGHSGSP
ncbi:hypothetical protein BsWGS_19051 [Bradybaena similaris]